MPRGIAEAGTSAQVPPATAPAPWLAAYTRARFEEKFRSYCEAQGIEAFLPSYLSWRRWSDRKKLLHLPLFPSYVFVRVGEGERRGAVRAPGFLWFVRNHSGPVQVEEGELEAVRRVLTSGLAYDPLPDAQLGDDVEVVTGALRGCRGRLLSKSGNAIVLLVTAIQAAVRVSLPDPSWVRALHPRPPAPVPAPGCDPLRIAGQHAGASRPPL